MKHYIKILILCTTIAFCSCSDDFVNEKTNISGVAESAIILSPEWDADDYEFICKDVIDADFTIKSKPEWLVLDSHSGKITDSIGVVHGSAKQDPHFSKIGFYVEQMIVEANNKQYAVPVYYITEGNPAVQVPRTFEVNYNNYNNVLQLSNTGDGILLWDVVSMPSWLKVDMSQVNPASVILAKGYTASLPLYLNPQAASQNNMEGTIVLKTNDKNNPLVEIAVTAYLGTPSLYYYGNPLDFGTTQTTNMFRISNQSSGILLWSFESLPEWLSVSQASGIVTSYNSTDLTFTCNRANIQPGWHSATFYLKSNDPGKASVAITVSLRVPGAGENIRPLEGNIVDAIFDKKTNTLYYVTSLPNKLVAYNVTAKTVLNEVPLLKAPTCLAISEDFTKALVGHGGAISNVDLASFQVSKTHVLSTTVYDVEWATTDWFCYTHVNSTTNLLWINTSTGETFESPTEPVNYSLGTSNLRKVPHQPYIIGTRTDGSPYGIFVFNTDTKTLKSYTHASIGNVWFLNQGELMATGASSVIRSSALTAAAGVVSNDPSSIGTLKIREYGNATWWADHSEATNSIWVIASDFLNAYYPPVKGMIYRFEDNDYTLVKTYPYDYIFQADAQSTPYEVEARYVFANGSGTQLSVLRKAASNNTWSIEFIPIE